MIVVRLATAITTLHGLDLELGLWRTFDLGGRGRVLCVESTGNLGVEAEGIIKTTAGFGRMEQWHFCRLGY
jgi:hypothetical protein